MSALTLVTVPYMEVNGEVKKAVKLDAGESFIWRFTDTYLESDFLITYTAAARKVERIDGD